MASTLNTSAPAPLVIEKVVYVEKPAAAPVKKQRPTHLRAVPDISLPFFDVPAQPVRREPVVERVLESFQDMKIADAPVAEEAGMASDQRERLEELLDELTGLKARLRGARDA